MNRQSKMRLRIVIGAIVLVGIQVAAWVIYRAIEARRANAKSTVTFAYELATGTAPAAEVPLERPNGSAIRLRDHVGSVVLVHFWATWCAPCRTELPMLLELANSKLGQHRLVVLLVSVDENWATVRHYFNGEVPSAVVRDATGLAQEAYEVTTLPETYLVRRGTVLSARVRGPRDWRSPVVQEQLAKLTGP